MDKDSLRFAVMTESEAYEFPFMAALPKREQRKVATAWEDFVALRREAQEKGIPLPVTFAARVLNVSRQRVYELIEAGRLQTVCVGDHTFVTSDSVEAYQRSDRSPGRRAKLSDVGAVVKAGWRYGQDLVNEILPDSSKK